MALRTLTRALGSLSLGPTAAAAPGPSLLPAAQVTNNGLLQLPSALLLPCRPILTSEALGAKSVSWKSHTKYTIRPLKMRKSGGRDHTGGSKGKRI